MKVKKINLMKKVEVKKNITEDITIQQLLDIYYELFQWEYCLKFTSGKETALKYLPI